MIQLLSVENIRIVEKVEDWKEAIRLAVAPLIEHGFVEERYVDGIFTNTSIYGPYYVLAPEIALPHARPDQGVIHQQIAILLLREPVKFTPDGYEVRILITLAAEDSTSHLQTLVHLSEFLGDDASVGKLLSAGSPEEIYSLFEMYSTQ